MKGFFKIWAIVDQNLHSIQIEIPRIFYVNSKISVVNENFASLEKKGKDLNRVYKTLPRSHPCLFLYKFEMNEREYIEKFKVIFFFNFF